MSVKNYIFDLDGTLIDSQDEIIFCIKKACENVIECNNFIDKISVGKPIRKMLEKYIGEEAVLNKVISNYREIYDNKTDDNSKIFSGTKKILEEIKEQNKCAYLLTNKPKKPTYRLLEKFEIKDYFDAIYTVDCFSEKEKSTRLQIIMEKHKLNPQETVMTGDSLEDIFAAKDNNILSVAALWGYEKDKAALMSNADFWLATSDFEGFTALTEKLNRIAKIN